MPEQLPPPPSAFRFAIPPLRLGLFDLGGVLHHANYLGIFEQTREAFLSEQGLPYQMLAEKRQHLAVREFTQRFDAPIFYGEKLQVAMWVSELKKSSLNVQYAIYKQDAPVPAHRASSLLCFVEEKEAILKPGRIPQELLEIFTGILDR